MRKKFILFICSLTFCLVTSELFFNLYTDFSTSFGNETLINRRWFTNYWKPINNLGYRDYDIHDTPHKDNVIVSGDSFVAGHGVKNIKHRFSNTILDPILKENYETFVVAKCGWDLNDSLESIKKYPIKPNILIQSVFVNDICNIASDYGLEVPVFETPSPITQILLSKSYSLSYAYLKLKLVTMYGAYGSFMKQAYTNKTILSQFQKQIENISLHSKLHHYDLIFLLWPNLKDLNDLNGIHAANKVILNNYNYIDTLPVLKGIENDLLFASELDAHPSDHVHGIIGKLIREYLIKNGFVHY